jgi:16S rRNA (adenine1518-N6/adenine1519-N6)-dimethyltransferase
MLKLIRNQWPTWTRIMQVKDRIISKDFLGMILMKLSEESNLLSSEFYNISTQIVLETLVATRFLNFRDVSERSSATHLWKKGNKSYGILSVLGRHLWCWICLLLTKLFYSATKVKSGVLRLRRKADYSLPCGEKLFLQCGKTFNNDEKPCVTA